MTLSHVHGHKMTLQQPVGAFTGLSLSHEVSGAMATVYVVVFGENHDQIAGKKIVLILQIFLMIVF